MPRGGWAPPGRVTSACDVAGTGLVHLPAERSPGAPTPPARFTASRMIAGIVLAAGFARRMGRQKLLLQLEGKPVVRWVVEGLLPRVEDVDHPTHRSEEHTSELQSRSDIVCRL